MPPAQAGCMVSLAAGRLPRPPPLASLAHAIQKAIDERGLTQREAADLMGIDQPKVSRILRGRLADFSTERLMKYLTGLGRDVEIVVKPAPRSRRKGRLRVAAG